MRFVVFTPTYKPVGGVVKILDYADHLLRLGHDVVIASKEELQSDLALFKTERFEHLGPEGDIEHVHGYRVGLTKDDYTFFSWPTDYEDIVAQLEPGTPLEHIVHIVQNTRHANPDWIGGYATRLLHRPMARVFIAHEVYEACEPHLNASSLSVVVPEGHDWPFFYKMRFGGLKTPIRVGYTTWKSKVGIEVEEALSDDDRFEFQSIRRTVDWAPFRELYHWSDVFLGTPGPQEGFYLVGLEALAAGSLLVIPDVGGNRAYCRFGDNCLEVPFDDAAAYVGRLGELADAPAGGVITLRENGYRALSGHTLEKEHEGVADFVDRLARRNRRPRTVRSERKPRRRRSGSVVQVSLEPREDPPSPVIDDPRRAIVPTFVGIGAQKAGTTWLHRNMQPHPELAFPTGVKEVHFLDRFFSEGLDWYLAHFESLEGSVRGEITPDYMIVDRSHVEWLHALNPDLRLLLLVRNPVDRAWSAARYYLGNRGVDITEVDPEQLRGLVSSGFMVRRGQYIKAIDLWSEVFSPEQLFVGFYEELVETPEDLLRKAFVHVGVDPDVDTSEYPLRQKFNVSKSAGLPDYFRDHLRELFSDEINEIAERFGSPATEW